MWGCVGGSAVGQPELILDGPSRVAVDRLGLVQPPVVRLEGGDPVQGVAWEASPTEVAHVRDGELHAVGPGEAVVRGVWQEQRVEWTLVVEPHVLLVVPNAPATLKVGQSEVLKVGGRAGQAEVAPGPLTFTSLTLNVLTVDAGGQVNALQPGVGYVQVTGPRSGEALVEIEVVAE